MNTDNPRLATLTAAVFAQIKDQFKEDDGISLTLVSPINECKHFDLFGDNADGSWDIQINGSYNAAPRLEGHPSMEAAKTRVAELISEEILASELLIERANAANLIPAYRPEGGRGEQ